MASDDVTIWPPYTVDIREKKSQISLIYSNMSVLNAENTFHINFYKCCRKIRMTWELFIRIATRKLVFQKFKGPGLGMGYQLQIKVNTLYIQAITINNKKIIFKSQYSN